MAAWSRPCIALLMTLLTMGCQTHPPLPPLPDPNQAAAPFPGLNAYSAAVEVEAVVAPPAGWIAQPLEFTGPHAHQVWLSPTRRTAYGVIHMRLPFPVGADLVLRGFLREMRRNEGQAHLIERVRDPDLPGIRFVAEGGRYLIRTNLLVHGRRAWAVYAGTLREEEVATDELALAESAREYTRVGLTEAAEEWSRSGRVNSADEQ